MISFTPAHTRKPCRNIFYVLKFKCPPQTALMRSLKNAEVTQNAVRSLKNVMKLLIKMLSYIIKIHPGQLIDL